MRLRICIAVVYLCFLHVKEPRALASGVEKLDTHGTVNIILANQTGAVIVTDSRLSNAGKVRGEAPKLFKLDDHTMCSVSGYYSSPGPSANGITYPANVAMANVIDALALDLPRLGLDTLERKAAEVGESVAFTLSIAWKISQAAGFSMAPPETSLLFLTHENGHYRIASLTVKAVKVQNDFHFIALSPEITEVRNALVYKIAGIEDVAEPILSSTVHAPTQDSLIARYRDAMQKNHGANLGVSDLLAIGREIAKLTSVSHRDEVGGVIQDAEFVGATVSFTTPYPRTLLDTNLLPGGNFGLIAHNHENHHDAFPHIPLLFLDNRFSNDTGFRLDQGILFRNEFRHCTLLLDSPDDFYFDQNNIVMQSVLSIGPNLSAETPSVRDLLVRYKGELQLEQR